MSKLNESRNQFISFNLNILDDFSVYGDELISAFYALEFRNHLELYKGGIEFFDLSKNEKLEERKIKELDYYSAIKHSLISKLQEIKHYSKVDVNNTRRLIATSNNCISSIHILIRSNMHVNVYFRSSNFSEALPADLEFISSLPLELLKHLKKFYGAAGYEEVDDKLLNRLSKMPIKLNLFFGSLHRI